MNKHHQFLSFIILLMITEICFTVGYCHWIRETTDLEAIKVRFDYYKAEK